MYFLKLIQLVVSKFVNATYHVRFSLSQLTWLNWSMCHLNLKTYAETVMLISLFIARSYHVRENIKLSLMNIHFSTDNLKM